MERTLMMAAIVIVNPQPIPFAMGRTNAEAAAANIYRTTRSRVSEKQMSFAYIHLQLFTAMTSALLFCIESMRLRSGSE
jgi:hypothetical protein